MIPAPTAEFALAEAGDAPRFEILVSLGDYAISPNEVIEVGELTLECSLSLGEIKAPSVTVTLDNASGKYSPRRNTFLFPDGIWFHQEITLSLAYYRPYSESLHDEDQVLLFRGLVVGWNNPGERDAGSQSPIAPRVAVITAMGLTGALLERLVGRPNDDGTPNPLIYGSVIKEGVDLRDDILWPPDKNWGAETGDTSECDAVVTAGAGTFAASTTEKYLGDYSFKAEITGGGASDEAYAWAYCTGAAVTTVMASVRLNLASAASFPNRVPFLLGFRNSGGTDVVNIAATTTGQVQLYVYGLPALINCDLDLNDILGIWVKLSLGLDLSVPGTVRLYLNGDVVGQADSNYAFTVDRAFLGFKKGTATATAWVGYYDDFKLDEPYYPLGYYLPGYPFTSINQAYRDGVVIPRKLPQYYYNREGRAGFQQPWVKAVFGRFVSDELYTADPDYGLVAFADVSDPPGGTVLIGATKNTTTHPADVIQGIATEVALDDHINAASFAAAKVANPDDIIGGHFEDLEAAGAIGEVCEKFMYNFYEDFGELYLQAYEAVPPLGSVLTLRPSLTVPRGYVAFGLNQDPSRLVSIVSAAWGWYQRDNTLFAREIDAVTQAAIDDVDHELSYEFSEAVSADDQDMVAAKLARLIKRLGRPVEICTVTGPLAWARLALYDEVEVVNTDEFDQPRVFHLFSKTYDFTGRTMTLTLARFLGEGE